MTPRDTHLDRLMTELGMENHELAAKAKTNRQSIYKLRNGNTRMLPHWAKRLAPHLGVSWQDLVDGPTSPVEQTRAELLTIYDSINDEQRRALMVSARAMSAQNTGELPPVRINRLMGHVPLDELDIGALEQELAALLAALRKRQAELNRPPPRPFQGGSVTENSVEDCRRVVTIPRGTRKTG